MWRRTAWVALVCVIAGWYYVKSPIAFDVSISGRHAAWAGNIAQIRAEGTEGLFDGMAQSLIGATARARRPDIVSELRARMTLTPEAAVAVQAGLAARPDSVPTVGTIDVPVLAIAGGEDSAVTPADMEAFNAAPGGCEFHLLPDAGHFAAYEQPEKVAALLAEWMKTPDEV